MLEQEQETRAAAKPRLRVNGGQESEWRVLFIQPEQNVDSSPTRFFLCVLLLNPTWDTLLLQQTRSHYLLIPHLWCFTNTLWIIQHVLICLMVSPSPRPPACYLPHPVARFPSVCRRSRLLSPLRRRCTFIYLMDALCAFRGTLRRVSGRCLGSGLLFWRDYFLFVTHF